VIFSNEYTVLYSSSSSSSSSSVVQAFEFYCLILEKNLVLDTKSGKCGQDAMAIKYKSMEDNN
jgi:hypothetical protein